MVSRQKRNSISNSEFEKIFPKEFIYFRDKSALEIIKFIIFFLVSFDSSGVVERFKQFGGATPPPPPPTGAAGAKPPPTEAKTDAGAAGKTGAKTGKDAKKDPNAGAAAKPGKDAKKPTPDADKENKSANNADSSDLDEEIENADAEDDYFLALLKSIYETAKITAIYIFSKVSVIFVTLIMWSAYPAIPFFAAMAAMAGVLKYIFWKFRIL